MNFSLIFTINTLYFSDNAHSLLKAINNSVIFNENSQFYPFVSIFQLQTKQLNRDHILLAQASEASRLRGSLHPRKELTKVFGKLKNDTIDPSNLLNLQSELHKPHTSLTQFDALRSASSSQKIFTPHISVHGIRCKRTCQIRHSDSLYINYLFLYQLFVYYLTELIAKRQDIE